MNTCRGAIQYIKAISTELLIKIGHFQLLKQNNNEVYINFKQLHHENKISIIHQKQICKTFCADHFAYACFALWVFTGCNQYRQ